MRARPAVRLRQYAAALARARRSTPGVYGPFTVGEYAHSDWQELDWCTRWPVAAADNPARPPVPPGGYPSVPVLVLSGELDSITTPAEGRLVTRQFPDAQQVVVRNSFHVTALGDTDGCAARLVRSFVRAPGPLGSRRHACANQVAPLRTMAVFPRGVRSVAPATATTAAPVRARRAGPVAALTVADVVDRWFDNYSGTGFGLLGGHWSYTGDKVTRFHLHRVRLVPGVAVSGTARWDRYGNTMRVRLRLTGSGPHGRLHGQWLTRRVGAQAVLAGTIDGQAVRLTFPAP
jgi:hypothetical protein